MGRLIVVSFTTLDVFTTTRYAGNPVSIIRVPASQGPTLTQSLKQKIAREFNLSEIVSKGQDLDPNNPQTIVPLTGSMNMPGIVQNIDLQGSATPFAADKKVDLTFAANGIRLDALVCEAGSNAEIIPSFMSGAFIRSS